MMTTDRINRELAEKYGKTLTGNAFFRIIQNSKSLTEKRFGTIDHFAGSIYIGSTEGIHELPKYSYFPEDFWVLERLYNTTNEELATNQSYEPLWVFRNPKDEGFQMPNLKACIFLIEMALKGPQAIPDEDEIKRKEAALFFEMLGGKADIGEKIGMDEGVSFAGLDPRTGGSEIPSLIKES